MKDIRYQKIEKVEIPQGNYEGYYWKSNQNKPTVQYEGMIPEVVFDEFPMSMEANFYDRVKQISIQVKNIDGIYHIAKIDLSELEDNKTKTVKYLGHDIGSNFELVESWGEKTDELSENMKTLFPTWVAFKGFVK